MDAFTSDKPFCKNCGANLTKTGALYRAEKQVGHYDEDENFISDYRKEAALYCSVCDFVH